MNMDYTKGVVIQKAQNAANVLGKDMIMYPEPHLGNNAWDYMGVDAFEVNGYEQGSDAVIIEPEN